MYKNYHIVGLCISRLYGNHSLSMLQALHRELTKFGYKLLVFHTCTDLEWSNPDEYGEEAVFDLIPFDILDALIIFDEAFYKKNCIQPIIDRAVEHNTPLIAIGKQYEEGYSVLYQYLDGFKMVLQHVLDEHKVKHPVMIAGYKGNSYSDARIDCFRKALLERGIEYSDNLVYYGDYWKLPTEKAAQDILDRPDRPDAIICVNDFTAIAICDYYEAKGIKVPQEFIITGFDGTNEALYAEPSITTSTFYNSSIAEKVGSILGKIFKGEIPPRTTNVDFSMRYGASCGCGCNLSLENAGALLKDREERLSGYNDLSRRHYELAERMITSPTKEGLIELLDKLHLANCCLMLNTDWADISVNPAKVHNATSFTEQAILAYQDEITFPNLDTIIPTTQLLPNFDEIIEKDYPITFNALNYLGLPIGYFVVYYKTIPYTYGQLMLYITAFDRAFGDFRNMQYLKHIAISMENLSNQDALTGLYNRKGFSAHLKEFIDNARSTNSKIAVASIDLDGLKVINDTYGHKSGDHAIATLADGIKTLPFDKSLCARFGGDEFVVCMILEDKDNPDEILSNVSQYIKRIQEHIVTPFTVSASVGYVICDCHDFDFEKVLKESDDKMYAVKSSKPNHRK